MTYKVKSFLYLSCFIVAFTVYNEVTKNSNNNYDTSNEIANADLQKVPPLSTLQIEKLK